MISDQMRKANEKINEMVSNCNQKIEAFNILSLQTSDKALAEAAAEAIEAAKQYTTVLENAVCIALHELRVITDGPSDCTGPS